MTVRWRLVALSAAALLTDAVVATVRAGAPTPPVAGLSLVAATGLVLGAPRALLVGAAIGALVDLLAAAATPGGLHLLVGVSVGAAACAGRTPAHARSAWSTTVGALLVTAGASATLVVQLGHWSAEIARLAVAVAPLSAVLCHLFARPIAGRVSEPLTTT